MVGVALLTLGVLAVLAVVIIDVAGVVVAVAVPGIGVVSFFSRCMHQ